MRRLVQLIGALLALGCMTPALAEPEVQVAPNVFVVPEANAKSVTFWMIIKAGCNDEPHANCHGLAHYVEHLVFLGRNADHKQVAARFFADAETNGFTTHKATVFWQRFPARAEGQTPDLEKLFRFYGEHLQRLDVSEEEAQRERNVVMQEYNLRFGRAPEQRFYSLLNRKLHPLHPEGQAVIGRKEDIEAFTFAEAKAFHDLWYARDNAIFVVHGPVDVAAVKELAEKYIAALPARAVPERDWRRSLYDFSPLDITEKAADKEFGARRVVTDKIIRFEETDRHRSDAARNIAAAFLRSALDGSPKDALTAQQEIADRIDFVEFSRETAGALEIAMAVTPRDGVSDEAALAAIHDYLAELARKGISEETVERLKKRAADARANLAKEALPSANFLVSWFSELNSYADYQTREKFAAAVTAQDVNDLLKLLNNPGRQISGVLSPLP